MKNDQCPSSPTLRERLIQHLVQPVPEDLAVCEFDCSAGECSREEWECCSRRKLAAGEQVQQPTPTS